jgi:hypothetical protein
MGIEAAKDQGFTEESARLPPESQIDWLLGKRNHYVIRTSPRYDGNIGAV